MTQPNPSSADAAALAGRALLAVLFIFSGIGKLSAPGPTIAYIASVGLPLPSLGLVIAVAVELGGGLLLLLGFLTRAVALLLTVFTIATAVFFHAHLRDQNQLIHFLKNVAIAGGFLQIYAFGAGRFSIDARRKSTA